MARKRPLRDPTPISSSEEEQGKENQQDEEEEESSQGNSSAEDDAFEEDAEGEEDKTGSGKVGSDSDNSLLSPNVSDKSVVSKPKKSSRMSTLKSKAVATESSSKQRKPSASASASNGGGDGSAKTPGTTRLWSEVDEIAILKGMIEYNSKKGSDPYSDSNGFHDFIEESIQADVSTYQLKEKIRRLKKKYKKNSERGQNGDDLVFLKPHDHTSFKLSEKIWGSGSNEKRQKKMKCFGSEDEEKEINGAVTLGLPCFIKDIEDKAEISTQLDSDSEEETVDIWKDYPFLKQACEAGSSAYVDGFKLLVERNDWTIGREKLRELEREARKLRMMQFELYLKRLELAREIARNAFDVSKGSEI